jgi:hypothetical protein
MKQQVNLEVENDEGIITLGCILSEGDCDLQTVLQLQKDLCLMNLMRVERTAKKHKITLV